MWRDVVAGWCSHRKLHIPSFPMPTGGRRIWKNASTNLEKRLHDIQIHFEEIMKTYPIDTSRVVTSGISQGSGMAVYTALSGRFPIRGFISIAVGWEDINGIADLAAHAGDVRGYFVIGEKDRTLQSARDIQKILRDNNVAFDEEVYPDLGHEWPPDLEKTFDTAIDYIFKERE
jgi:predicted esterase